MRYRRHISDAGDVKSCSLKRAYRSFPSGARTFNQNVYLPQSHIHSPSCGLLSGPLGGKGGTLARPFETHGAGASRGNHIPLGIGKTDQGVVKSRIYICPALGHGPAFPPSRSSPCHDSIPLYFLPPVRRPRPATVRRGPLRVRALVLVLWPCTGSPRRCRSPR